MFSKENEAYKRIVDMTLFLGNEEAAAILEHRILVIPNYVNDTTTISWRAFGYHFEKNNITGPLLGKPLIILATVHTHPSGGGPSTWIYDGGYGDLDFAGYSTPYKPVYIFQIG